MRTRSTSSYSPLNFTNHYTQWNNSTSPTAEYDNTEVAQDQKETKYMEDVVVPQYRKRIARGEIINNAMMQTLTYEKFAGGSLDMGFLQDNGSGKKTGFTSVGKWLAPLTASNRFLSAGTLNLTSIKDQAVISANEKVTAHKTELLATMGEMNETVASLVAIFKRVANIVIALKKLQFKKLAKELSPKELASRYMEARYAIRPMVIDAINILEALKTRAEPKREAFRGGTTQTVSTSDVVVIRSSTYYKVWGRRVTEYTAGSRAGVLVVADQLTDLHIWGLDRVLSSAWELVPLSYILGWFCNIASLISAWQPKAGFRHLASWVVLTETTIQSCTIDHCDALWPTSSILDKHIAYSGMVYKITTKKERFTNPSLPVLPSLDIKLDVLKLLDLGIIMRNFAA